METCLAAWSPETTYAVYTVAVLLGVAACAAIGYAIGRPKGLGAAGLVFGLCGSVLGLVVITLLKPPRHARTPARRRRAAGRRRA